MTFSITVRCPASGMFGLAVASSSQAVAARCAHARAGIGAVASQNVTDPSLGPACLDLMAAGSSAAEALAELRRTQPDMEWRQLLAVDRQGGTAAHSGARTMGIGGDCCRENVACGGNLLADRAIPALMAEAFNDSSGELGDRLLAALRRGLAAGGETEPVHSAGMMLVRGESWPLVDLRCDWHDDGPIEALADLWARYRPQMEDFALRAGDPSAVRPPPRPAIRDDQ